jgi:hypothetical protein
MKKNKKAIVDPKAVIPGRKYEPEKPWSCEYCYFWKSRKKGCELENCQYLLQEVDQKMQMEKIGDCRTCPYGKHSPCIGYCIAKLLAERGDHHAG